MQAGFLTARTRGRRRFLAGAGTLLALLSPAVLASQARQQAEGKARPGAPGRRKHVYIIHGYKASPTDHWFPWLKRRLLEDGVGVDVLRMPDPEHPRAASWDAFLDKHITRHDEDTFFVAHSLGSISLLRHLAGKQGTRIGGIVLVSGFSEPLPALPQLDEFTAGTSLATIARMAPQRHVIAARDDAIVPYAFAARLAERLQARLHKVDRGGHFLGSDGFTEFPLVYRQLRAMTQEA
jgi:hypothetical protein